MSERKSNSTPARSLGYQHLQAIHSIVMTGSVAGGAVTPQVLAACGAPKSGVYFTIESRNQRVNALGISLSVRRAIGDQRRCQRCAAACSQELSSLHRVLHIRRSTRRRHLNPLFFMPANDSLFAEVTPCPWICKAST